MILHIVHSWSLVNLNLIGTNDVIWDLDEGHRPTSINCLLIEEQNIKKTAQICAEATNIVSW